MSQNYFRNALMALAAGGILGSGGCVATNTNLALEQAANESPDVRGQVVVENAVATARPLTEYSKTPAGGDSNNSDSQIPKWLDVAAPPSTMPATQPSGVDSGRLPSSLVQSQSTQPAIESVGRAKIAAPATIPAAERRTASPAPVSELQAVVVTASRVETSAIDVPADVTVITKADLPPSSNDLVSALGRVPGVRVDNRPADSAFGGFEIRGFSTNDTSGTNALILLDGLPQRRLSFGGPYLGLVPFNAASRIEVVKGPLASLYGEGALAGVVQVFTEPGTSEFHLTTSAMYRSTIRTVEGTAQVTGPIPGIDGATFSLTGTGRSTQGWADDTDGSKQDVYFHGRLPFGDSDVIDLIFGYANGQENSAAPVLVDNQGHRLPGIDRDTNLAVPGQNNLSVQETRLGGTWTHKYDPTFSSTLSLSYWHGDTTTQLGRPSNRPTTGTIVSRLGSNRFWDENYYWGKFEVQKKLNPTEWLHLTATAGGELGYFDWINHTQGVRTTTSTFGTGIPINLTTLDEPPRSSYVYGPFTARFTTELDYGVYGRLQADIEPFTFQFGVRYDGYRRYQMNETTDLDSTVNDGAVSPTVGVLWHAIETKNVTVNPYFNFGYGFAPVFRAVGTTEIVKVDPETSVSYELGVKSLFFNGLLEATAEVYHIERNNVVELDAATNTYGNFANWQIEGIETGITLRPTEKIQFYASYTYRQPEIKDDFTNATYDGNEIPLISRSVCKFGVAVKPIKELTFGIDAQYFSSSFGNYANSVHLPDYFLLDASVSYQIRNYTFSIFATNLLDTEYFSSTFVNANGSVFEGLPRSVGVRVSTYW